jgi:hypothetical protein
MKEEEFDAYAGCLKASLIGLLVCIAALIIGAGIEGILISFFNWLW